METAADFAEPHPEIRRGVRLRAVGGQRQDDLVELLQGRAGEAVELVQLAQLRNAAACDERDLALQCLERLERSLLKPRGERGRLRARRRLLPPRFGHWLARSHQRPGQWLPDVNCRQ